jgi:hypothetical protein
MVSHIYNLSYSEGRAQECLCSRPAWAKTYQDPHFELAEWLK